jgi:predicted nucleic acid-binding protein
MMLVDTSVWIDFLADRSTTQVKALELALDNRESICICGVVLMEVLQGFRFDAEYAMAREFLDDLIYLSASKETHGHAADLFRALRKRGITVRGAADCLIAAVAMENGMPLLHNDRDFEAFEKHFGLGRVCP